MISTKQYKIMFFKKMATISSILCILFMLYQAVNYIQILPSQEQILAEEQGNKKLNEMLRRIKTMQLQINNNQKIEEEYKKTEETFLVDSENLKNNLSTIFNKFVGKYSFINNVKIETFPSDTYINSALVRIEVLGAKAENQDEMNVAAAILLKKFIEANKNLFSYYEATLVNTKNIIAYTFYRKAV